MSIRRLRANLSRRWDRFRAPWPIVGECHGHLIRLTDTPWLTPEDRVKCLQCDGGHAHEWKPWPDAPRWVTSSNGTPIRCRKCGARKCDHGECSQRRHGHTHWDEVPG